MLFSGNRCCVCPPLSVQGDQANQSTESLAGEEHQPKVNPTTSSASQDSGKDFTVPRLTHTTTKAGWLEPHHTLQKYRDKEWKLSLRRDIFYVCDNSVLCMSKYRTWTIKELLPITVAEDDWGGVNGSLTIHIQESAVPHCHPWELELSTINHVTGQQHRACQIFLSGAEAAFRTVLAYANECILQCNCWKQEF